MAESGNGNVLLADSAVVDVSDADQNASIELGIELESPTEEVGINSNSKIAGCVGKLNFSSSRQKTATNKANIEAEVLENNNCFGRMIGVGSNVIPSKAQGEGVQIIH
ncbi:hypothetical protein HPP92_006988 [Vanilla planifolia]|uniref:Uncharacterized protein n=1 Tax=Vanilla planifolia TaxID=51239 RepID=A0A835RKY3_VANPL|nr:hypothetical protein HPP92_006988 [Vanilla planifolia]